MPMPNSIGSSGGFGGQSRNSTDIAHVFELLESPDGNVVQDVKDMIVEQLNSTRENWVVNALYEYFIQSGSARCSEILCGISREPHDKHLIERMTESIRSTTSKDPRKQALVLLGHAVSKQSSWLTKITQQSLFKELLKLLKTETDVVILLSGLLSLIMMLPIIPTYIVPYHSDFFEVFGRLATWTNTTQNIPKEHILHLQVGLYSLFHRLYAMFPCNFLSYLRHSFGSPDKRLVFLHTIMPMLGKVKMHPNLVLANRESELNINRWQSRDYHDIIAECSKISLDPYESSLPEETPTGFTSMGANCSSMDVSSPLGNELNLEDMLNIRASSLLIQAMDGTNINSLSCLEDGCNTAPPTPLSVTTTNNHPFSSHGADRLTIKPLPAETAMEATPENTPVKDKDRSHFRLPLQNTTAAIQLFGSKEDRHDRPVPQTPPATPYSSVPSSPLPVTSSMTRRDSIFDTNHFQRREPDRMLLRLQKVQMEQQQAALLQLNGDSSQLPPVTPPVDVAKKVAVVAPNACSSEGASSNVPPSSVDNTQDTDKSVSTGGPLTPILPHSASGGTNFIDPALSLITLDEERTGGLDECATTACPSGGLHMADHQSIVAFANKVHHRFRYHSHCLAGSDFNTSRGPSPGTSPSSTSSGVISARSRYMKRSMSCPDIKKPGGEDKDGNLQKPSKLPEVAEVSTVPEEEKEDKEPEEEAQLLPKEPPHPYEHLFQKILPGVLSPLDARTLPSPHRLLDTCLIKAADLQNVDGKFDEVALLRGHVELLHGQLLFERHRREAHALRNRRLAGKCRRTVTLEEQNNTMSQKLHNQEKQIASLMREITLQRNVGLVKEGELQKTIDSLQAKLESYKKDVSELNREKIQLESKYSRLSDEFNSLHRELDQKKADYFCLENEVKNCQKYIERNKELKTAYEARLREILLLGEVLRKYKELMTPPSECRYLMDEDYRLAVEEEARSLRSMLEHYKSQQEAANGQIVDLKKRLEKRENIIEDQRKDIQEKEKEFVSNLQDVRSKYEAIKTENQKLEWDILSLKHQLNKMTAMSSRPSRGRICSANSPSNNGDISPAGNSNHSDVDSAASAGGLQMSPDRNMFIFGSPQE